MLDSLIFAPLVPVWVLVLCAIVGAPIIAVHLFQHVHGGLLRLAALGLILLALANPIERHEQREALSDIAIVVLDDSASQQIGARKQRMADAEKRLRKQFEQISNLDVRWVTFQPANGREGGGTRLFTSLSNAMLSVPPERFAGAIFITDGEVHDVPGAGTVGAVKGPLHALITGGRSESDRRIVIDQAPRFAIIGQQRFISLKIIDTGPLAAKTANDATVALTVTVDGKTSRTYDLPVDQRVNVPVTISHGGRTVIELVAEGADGEITLRNNRALVTTEGIRERLRVLLVSGEPHAGERTWRKLLKADAAVDLVHFTILRPPEKQDGTPIRELSLIAFPTRELFSVKLNEFDLIIFDRYQRRGVLPLVYLVNVADFVENGGAVLAAAGPAFATPLSLYRTPLSQVLPSAPTGGVIEQPFRPTLTEKGRRHPVTRGLERNPGDAEKWGRWFRQIDAETTTGDVVMAGAQKKPLVVLSRYGKGRVAQLLSDHAWLWARGYDGGGPQAELLRRIAHWLMKQPDLEEEALIGRHSGARLMIERRTMKDSVSPVEVTSPSGKTTELILKKAKPGLWQATLRPGEMGLYRLKDAGLQSVVAVGVSDPREMQRLDATDDILKPVLTQTGGRSFWLDGGTKAAGETRVPRLRMVDAGRRMGGESWLGLRRNHAHIVTALDERALLSGLIATLLVLLITGLAWYREGR